MKTRIIQTSFWRDSNGVMTVSKNARYLWLFLLTNEYLGMSNYIYLPDVFKMHHTGLSQKELNSAKKELEETKKIFFVDDWVYIKNLEEKNKYKNSPKNKEGYEAELKAIPNDIKERIELLLKETDSTIDTTIDSSTDTTLNTKIRKLNTKTKKLKPKKDDFEILKKEDIELKEIVEHYNFTFGKNIRSTAGFKSNFLHWREIHDIDKIKQAISHAKMDSYWSDKMDLQILFRKKNPRGEPVDYIEKMYNSTPSDGSIAFN